MATLWAAALSELFLYDDEEFPRLAGLGDPPRLPPATDAHTPTAHVCACMRANRASEKHALAALRPAAARTELTAAVPRCYSGLTHRRGVRAGLAVYVVRTATVCGVGALAWACSLDCVCLGGSRACDRHAAPGVPPHTHAGNRPRCGSRATAPGLPHLHQDWAHACHICTRTGLTPATSAPGLGSPLPHLHRDRGLSMSRASPFRAASTARGQPL